MRSLTIFSTVLTLMVIVKSQKITNLWIEQIENCSEEKIKYCERTYDNKYGTGVTTWVIKDKNGKEMNKQLAEANQAIALHGVWPKEICCEDEQFGEVRLMMKNYNNKLPEIQQRIKSIKEKWQKYGLIFDFSKNQEFMLREYHKHFYENGLNLEAYENMIETAIDRIMIGTKQAYPHDVRFNEFNWIEQVVDVEKPDDVVMWNYKILSKPGREFANPLDSNKTFSVTEFPFSFDFTGNMTYAYRLEILKQNENASYPKVFKALNLLFKDVPIKYAVKEAHNQILEIYDNAINKNYTYFGVILSTIMSLILVIMVFKQIHSKVEHNKYNDMISLENFEFWPKLTSIMTVYVIISYFNNIEQFKEYSYTSFSVCAIVMYLFNSVSNTLQNFNIKITIYMVSFISCVLSAIIKFNSHGDFDRQNYSFLINNIILPSLIMSYHIKNTVTALWKQNNYRQIANVVGLTFFLAINYKVYMNSGPKCNTFFHDFKKCLNSEVDVAYVDKDVNWVNAIASIIILNFVFESLHTIYNKKVKKMPITILALSTIYVAGQSKVILFYLGYFFENLENSTIIGDGTIVNLVVAVFVLFLTQQWSMFTNPIWLLTEFLLLLPVIRSIGTYSLFGLEQFIERLIGEEQWKKLAFYGALTLYIQIYSNIKMRKVPNVWRICGDEGIREKKAYKKSIWELFKIITTILISGLSLLMSIQFIPTDLISGAQFTKGGLIFHIGAFIILGFLTLSSALSFLNVVKIYKTDFGTLMEYKVNKIMLLGLNGIFTLGYCILIVFVTWQYITNIVYYTVVSEFYASLLPIIMVGSVMNALKWVLGQTIEFVKYQTSIIKEFEQNYTRGTIQWLLNTINNTFNIMSMGINTLYFMKFVIRFGLMLMTIQSFALKDVIGLVCVYIPYIFLMILGLDMYFNIIYKINKLMTNGMKFQRCEYWERENSQNVYDAYKNNVLDQQVNYNNLMMSVWDHLLHLEVQQVRTKRTTNETNIPDKESNGTVDHLKYNNVQPGNEDYHLLVRGRGNNVGTRIDSTDTSKKQELGYIQRNQSDEMHDVPQQANWNKMSDLNVAVISEFTKVGTMYTVKKPEKSNGRAIITNEFLEEEKLKLTEPTLYCPSHSTINARSEQQKIATMLGTATVNDNQQAKTLLEVCGKQFVNTGFLVDVKEVYVLEKEAEDINYNNPWEDLKNTIMQLISSVVCWRSGTAAKTIFTNKSEPEEGKLYYKEEDDNIYTLQEYIDKENLTIGEIISRCENKLDKQQWELTQNQKSLFIFVNTYNHKWVTESRTVALNIQRRSHSRLQPEEKKLHLMKPVSMGHIVRCRFVENNYDYSLLRPVHSDEFGFDIMQDCLYEPKMNVYLTYPISMNQYKGGECLDLIMLDDMTRLVIAACTGLVYKKNIAKDKVASHVGSCSLVRDAEMKNLYIVTAGHVVDGLEGRQVRRDVMAGHKKCEYIYNNQAWAYFGLNGKTYGLPMNNLIAKGSDYAAFRVSTEDSNKYVFDVAANAKVSSGELWRRIPEPNGISEQDVVLVNSVRQSARVEEKNKHKVHLNTAFVQKYKNTDIYTLWGYTVFGYSGSPLWSVTWERKSGLDCAHITIEQRGIVSQAKIAEFQAELAGISKTTIISQIINGAMLPDDPNQKLKYLDASLFDANNIILSGVSRARNIRNLVDGIGTSRVIEIEVEDTDKFVHKFSEDSGERVPVPKLRSSALYTNKTKKFSEQLEHLGLAWEQYEDNFDMVELTSRFTMDYFEDWILEEEFFKTNNRNVRFEKSNAVSFLTEDLPVNDQLKLFFNLEIEQGSDYSMKDFATRVSEMIRGNKIGYFQLNKITKLIIVPEEGDYYTWFFLRERQPNDIARHCERIARLMSIGQIDCEERIAISDMYEFTQPLWTDYTSLFEIARAFMEGHIMENFLYPMVDIIDPENGVLKITEAAGDFFFEHVTKDNSGYHEEWITLEDLLKMQPCVAYCFKGEDNITPIKLENENKDSFIEKIRQLQEEKIVNREIQHDVSSRIADIRAQIADYKQQQDYLDKKAIWDREVEARNLIKEELKATNEANQDIKRKLREKRRNIEVKFNNEIKAKKNQRINVESKINERRSEIKEKREQNLEKLQTELDQLTQKKKQLEQRIKEKRDGFKNRFDPTKDKVIVKLQADKDRISTEIQALTEEKNALLAELKAETDALPNTEIPKLDQTLNPDTEAKLKTLLDELSKLRKENSEIVKEGKRLSEALEEIKKGNIHKEELIATSKREAQKKDELIDAILCELTDVKAKLGHLEREVSNQKIKNRNLDAQSECVSTSKEGGSVIRANHYEIATEKGSMMVELGQQHQDEVIDNKKKKQKVDKDDSHYRWADIVDSGDEQEDYYYEEFTPRDFKKGQKLKGREGAPETPTDESKRIKNWARDTGIIITGRMSTIDEQPGTSKEEPILIGGKKKQEFRQTERTNGSDPKGRVDVDRFPIVEVTELNDDLKEALLSYIGEAKGGENFAFNKLKKVIHNVVYNMGDFSKIRENLKTYYFVIQKAEKSFKLTIDNKEKLKLLYDIVKFLQNNGGNSGRNDKEWDLFIKLKEKYLAIIEDKIGDYVKKGLENAALGYANHAVTIETNKRKYNVKVVATTIDYNDIADTLNAYMDTRPQHQTIAFFKKTSVPTWIKNIVDFYYNEKINNKLPLNSFSVNQWKDGKMWEQNNIVVEYNKNMSEDIQNSIEEGNVSFFLPQRSAQPLK